ncbi:MAG TPA: transglycosylase domain-containing protein [Kofleriaceae bacterium]|nr:transglycosylase domain-containing protein [Kofleriaceae bacterium]
MRLPPLSRRWLIAGGFGRGGLLLVAILLGIVYPRVGAWMIRSRVGAKIAARTGRTVTFGSIDVHLGHATLRGVELRGPHDGAMPLVHIDRIDVDFNTARSLVGSLVLGEAKLDGVVVNLRRDTAGVDNVRDLFEPRGQGGSSGSSTRRPTKITVTHGRLVADDQLTGATVLVADADATWTPDGLTAHARGITATTTGAPKAALASLEIEKPAGAAPMVSLEGGELALWPKLSLSGIGGKIVEDPATRGRFIIDLSGGYGGVPGTLWTAKGDLVPAATTASLDLEAAKFQLDRLAPILEHSAVVDYQSTSVDTSLHLDADKTGARFSGQFHLSGLNVGHPYIAEKEVRDLDMSGQIAGSYTRDTRTLELTKGDFVVHNLPFSITGSAVRAPHIVDETQYIPLGAANRDKKGPRKGPHGLQAVSLRFVIPTIGCQKVLDAIPTEMAPYMAGYKIKGMFDADIHLAIDWNDLDALDLGGHVGINKCKVVDEPEDSPKRLKDEFDQYVETEKGEWESFKVGPSNPDFVPIQNISPYLISSIISSEDYNFYKHHGFIPTEFRSALVNNLKSGAFVQGASSITMQMVKNVLLYREKTLARKLQELFLTWHVENTLDKDRIMEIYLNVIEYGPDLYGIGPAAHEYFGKQAKDLNPVEAAFFSSILPNPKDRYRQYCQNTLTKWTEGKIQRQLAKMFERKQLTQEEYDKAQVTPLVFVKDGSESEEDCLKRVKKAIKNARPTNPLADKPDPDDPKKKTRGSERPHPPKPDGTPDEKPRPRSDAKSGARSDASSSDLRGL